MTVLLASCGTAVVKQSTKWVADAKYLENSNMLRNKGLGLTIDKSNVIFAYMSTNNPIHVRLAGNFNGWHTIQDQMIKDTNGIWRITKTLPSGTYQYKYVEYGEKFVDSEMKWFQDPACTNAMYDGEGGFNSCFNIE